jgi:Berberine and berberine like
VGSPAAAERLIAPLRAVATPLLDTVRPLPIVEFGTIHGDPTRPQPVSCGGAVLPRWDDAAVAVLLAEIGRSTPHMLELRHLGGALARPPAVADAVGHRDAGFTVFTSAYPGPAFEAAAAAQTAMFERLLPWSGGRSLYNFTARPDGRHADARGAFDEPTFARLRSVKATYDPQNLFRYNVSL